MYMKITEQEQSIGSISDVIKGRFIPGSPHIKSRYSDCLVFVLTGRGEYYFSGKQYIALPGDVIYLAHRSAYSVHVTDENYTYFYVDFLFQNPEKTVFENEIYHAKGVASLESSFEKLYRLWKSGDFADRIYCKALLYQIYSELTRSRFSQYVSADCRSRIEQTVEYMAQNLEKGDLCIGELSRRCRISEVHFRRLFACIYHTSPVKFITSLRIKKAKELLLSGGCAIAEVAEACGFQNHYYFSKIFKNETGMTPSQYRKTAGQS